MFYSSIQRTLVISTTVLILSTQTKSFLINNRIQSNNSHRSHKSSTIFCNALNTKSTTTTTTTANVNRIQQKIVPPVDVWPKLVIGGKEDPAMGLIEEQQRSSNKPYGRLLDAGTGSYSLRWLAQILYRHSDPEDALHMSNFVAVTADEIMRRNVQKEADELGVSEYGDIIIGNWAAGIDTEDDDGEKYLCEGQVFDTILADYLLGAVDHFAPFFQDQLFPRLIKHLAPGGRMYITGLNPIPEKVEENSDDDNLTTENNVAANLFCQITKLRDACILLAGSRPYREHPVEWVERHLPLSGLTVLDVSKFPKTYTYNAILLQLDAARSTLKFIKDEELKNAMSDKIDRLDKEAKEACECCPDGKFVLGFDWIITAEKTMD